MDITLAKNAVGASTSCTTTHDIEDLQTQLGIDETEHSTVVKKYPIEVVEAIYCEQVALTKIDWEYEAHSHQMYAAKRMLTCIPEDVAK